MNKDDYIRAVDNIHASDELKNRILAERTQKKFILKKQIIAVACIFFAVMIPVAGVIVIRNTRMGKSADKSDALYYDIVEENAVENINPDGKSQENNASISADSRHIEFALTALSGWDTSEFDLSESYCTYNDNDKTVTVHFIGEKEKIDVTVSDDDTQIINMAIID